VRKKHTPESPIDRGEIITKKGRHIICGQKQEIEIVEGKD